MHRGEPYLWRRLDSPGHDACVYSRSMDGWQLSGSAAFIHVRSACQLRYDVFVDAAFVTRRASVTGFIGRRAVDLSIEVDAPGHWRCNGRRVAGLDDCTDLDLGFTPATNLLSVRRLRLRVGEAAEVPAAYLHMPGLQLERLAQRYERIGERAYRYAAPRFGYRGTLSVTASGAIAHYPGLFERVKPG